LPLCLKFDFWIDAKIDQSGISYREEKPEIFSDARDRRRFKRQARPWRGR
jgi:hypothetical protein